MVKGKLDLMFKKMILKHIQWFLKCQNCLEKPALTSQKVFQFAVRKSMKVFILIPIVQTPKTVIFCK